METIFTTELIQTLGVGAIPILIIVGVIYRLFQIIDKMYKSHQDITNKFNITMQEYITANTKIMDKMLNSFEIWRIKSLEEHSKIMNNQQKMMKKLKIN